MVKGIKDRRRGVVRPEPSEPKKFGHESDGRNLTRRVLLAAGVGLPLAAGAAALFSRWMSLNTIMFRR